MPDTVEASLHQMFTRGFGFGSLEGNFSSVMEAVYDRLVDHEAKGTDLLHDIAVKCRTRNADNKNDMHGTRFSIILFVSNKSYVWNSL